MFHGLTHYIISVDYIIYGNAHEKAAATINDAILISYFKEVEKILDEKKNRTQSSEHAYS